MQILADISPGIIQHYAQMWARAISGPSAYLARSFQPTSDQVTEGIGFFLAMIAVSTMFSIAAGFSQAGSAGDKIKSGANGFLGLFFGAISAIAAHFPFVLFGGKATFSGTYLAYCYAAGPYLPLISFAALIMLSGYPARLRAYAIAPQTAPLAFAAAQQDPETSNLNLYLGAFLLWGVMIWSYVAMIRALSFAHELSGLRLTGAIVVSFVLFAIVGKVLQGVSSLLLPPPPPVTDLQPPAVQSPT